MPENYDQDDLAPYDPQSPVGGAGSGSGFGVNLYYLYKAGQIEMPSIAQRYLGFATTTHSAASTAQSYAPTAGSPAALTGLADVLDDLHHAFNVTVTSVRDCGVALSQIAQRYAASDEQASSAFNSRVKDVEGADDADFTGRAPEVADPPAVDSEPPVYGPPGPGGQSGPPTEPPELDDPPTEDQPDVELPDEDDPDIGGGGSTD